MEQRELYWKQVLTEQYITEEQQYSTGYNEETTTFEIDKETKLLEIKVQNRLLEQAINNHREQLQKGNFSLLSNSEIIIELRTALEYLLKTLLMHHGSCSDITSNIADLYPSMTHDA